MRLIEFLNSPLKWKSNGHGSYMFQYNDRNFVAHFQVDDVEISMGARSSRLIGLDPEDKVADFEFGPMQAGGPNFKITGKGGEIQIFSTIREIIHDYASTNRHNLVGIVFTANVNEPTRVKLYTRMLPKIAKEINAIPHNSGNIGSYHEFFLEFK